MNSNEPGDLDSSTLLNLLVVLLVYARFGYVEKEEAEGESGTTIEPTSAPG